MSTESYNTAGGTLKDVVRYTMLSDNEAFTNNCLRTVEKLEKKGYIKSSIRNTFYDGVEYKGVNTNFSANGYIFELQFHTPRSFEVKMGEGHRLYEEKRVLNPDNDSERLKIAEISRQLVALSNTIHNPPNVSKIK